MDRDTIIKIMELLANAKREYLKVVDETEYEAVKQCYLKYANGMNMALDKIYGYARRNEIDVSEVEW